MEFVDLATQASRLRPVLDDAMARVLTHHRYIDGPEIDDLEAQLASRAGVEHVVTCSSGTDALVLSLLALGVRPGDLVVVPTFTFAATAEAVAFVGATPLFVDVNRVTFNLEPASLARAFESPAGERIVGVIPVELFGHPADVSAIDELARAHGAWVLVDAAQSFGALAGGRSTLASGRAATTSFFPAKPLGCYGDGGAIFTSDHDLAAILRSLRSHGAGTDRYDNVRIGMTGRLDTLQAAVLLAKLTIFDAELEARQAIADRYADLLSAVVTTPSVAKGQRSAWAVYTCQLDHRDEVAEALSSSHVPTAIYYRKPLHHQPAYRDFPVVSGGTPVADELCARVLSLPMHPYLTADEQQTVTDVMGRMLART